MGIPDLIAQSVANQKFYAPTSNFQTISANVSPCIYNPPNSGLTLLIVNASLLLFQGQNGLQPMVINTINGQFVYKRLATPPTLVGSTTPFKNISLGDTSPVALLGTGDAGYNVQTSIGWGQNIDLQPNTISHLTDFADPQNTQPIFVYPGDTFGSVLKFATNNLLFYVSFVVV